MTECPNCVTPWKCNGPHMTDDLPLPTEEIAAYWDIAYAEADRNARYDTSDGSAQSALQDLQEAIRAYGDARAAAAVAQERERTKALRKLLMKASGTMSCERWSTDFREQVYFAIRDGK